MKTQPTLRGVVRKLSGGGSCELLVIDRPDAGQVLIQTPRPRLWLRAELMRDFQHQGTLYRELNHASLLPAVDTGVLPDGRPFLMTELPSGQDLRRYLRRAAPLTLGRVLNISFPICEGLEHAARRGLVHGNLSSLGVRIDTEGRPHLYGFALTRGEGSRPTAHDDVRAVGMLMLEMLTGSRGPAVIEMLPPSTQPIRSVLRRCLAAGSFDGFASMAQVSLALKTIASAFHVHLEGFGQRSTPARPRLGRALAFWPARSPGPRDSETA